MKLVMKIITGNSDLMCLMANINFRFILQNWAE